MYSALVIAAVEEEFIREYDHIETQLKARAQSRSGTAQPEDLDENPRF